MVNNLPSTVQTNAKYQQALKSQGSGVWQYYQLVMTQWPVPGNAPQNQGTPKFSFPGTGANSAFSNTVLETFDQGSIGTGCMACHTVTQKATDFLWSLADHAYPPKIPSLLMQDPSFRSLKNLIEGNQQKQPMKPQPGKKPAAKPKTKAPPKAKPSP